MWNKGQKLVCVIEPPRIAQRGPSAGKPVKIPPKLNEVVTCNGPSYDWPDSITIVEYPKATSGNFQSFRKKYFVPLEDWQEADYMVGELLEELTVKV